MFIHNSLLPHLLQCSFTVASFLSSYIVHSHQPPSSPPLVFTHNSLLPHLLQCSFTVASFLSSYIVHSHQPPSSFPLVFDCLNFLPSSTPWLRYHPSCNVQVKERVWKVRFFIWNIMVYSYAIVAFSGVCTNYRRCCVTHPCHAMLVVPLTAPAVVFSWSSQIRPHTVLPFQQWPFPYPMCLCNSTSVSLQVSFLCNLATSIIAVALSTSLYPDHTDRG